MAMAVITTITTMLTIIWMRDRTGDRLARREGRSDGKTDQTGQALNL
jgi:hypothetical protein